MDICSNIEILNRFIYWAGGIVLVMGVTFLILRKKKKGRGDVGIQEI